MEFEPTLLLVSFFYFVSSVNVDMLKLLIEYFGISGETPF
jgi:hypothetical protein